MQKLKKVNYWSSACTKWLAIAVSVSWLGGCAVTGEAEKPEAEQPAAEAKKEQISPQARKDYEKALEAMRSGDNGQAKTLLASLSQTYPDLSGPYTNLGLIHFREGDIDKAEEAFLQAIKVNPNSAVSYNHLGIINRGKGKFKEAETFYKKSLEISKDYAYAHLNIGILYDLYLGELEKALDHYQRFQELTPKKDEEVNKWIVDLKRRVNN
jgi:Tfp pilus assembly protein PilF